MPPIRKGDGTAVAPKGISQVRTGDGRILFDGPAIPDGGVSRWKFAEGSGETVADDWNDNDGTIDGPSWQSDGQVGDFYLEFDDSRADRVVVPHDDNLDIEGSMTLMCWIRGESSNTARIIVKGDPDNKSYELWQPSSGGLSLRINGNDDARGGSLDSDWNHCAGVFDADDGEIRVYINGSEVDTQSTSDTPDANGQDLILGNELNEDQGLSNQDLDDPRIYERALSESEINDIVDNPNSE